MSDPLTLWLLAVVATGGGALYLRMGRRQARYERENHALWYYTRHLIDWGFRPHSPDETPPQPPASIAHLYEFGDTQ